MALLDLHLADAERPVDCPSAVGEEENGFGDPNAARPAATGTSGAVADGATPAEESSASAGQTATGGGATALPDTGGMLTGTALLLLSCGVLGIVAHRRTT